MKKNAFSFFVLMLTSVLAAASPNNDLIEAAKYGKLEAALTALNAGADPNIREDAFGVGNGITPLIYASMGNYHKVIELLAQRSADLNLKAIGSWTPLTVAVSRGHLESVQILIRFRADVNLVGVRYHSSLYLASESGNLAIVDELVRAGATVDLDDNILKYTALMIAAEKGQDVVVEYLIRHGSNINHMNDEGFTALTVSARSSQTKTLYKLVSHGADVNKGNKRYAISYASHHGLADAVDLLIAKGANVNFRSLFDNTALHQAVVNDNVRIAAALLRAGAFINAVNIDNSTPIMWAAAAGSIESVKLLISKRADLKVRDNVQHKSAYELAKENGHQAVADLIAKAGG